MKQNVGKISTVIEFRYISAVKGGNIHRSMAKIKPVFRLTILKKKKRIFPSKIFSVKVTKLVTFTEEIRNGKLRFLFSVYFYSISPPPPKNYCKKECYYFTIPPIYLRFLKFTQIATSNRIIFKVISRSKRSACWIVSNKGIRYISTGRAVLNPFSTNVLLLYPLKTSENWGFLMFSGGIEIEH